MERLSNTSIPIVYFPMISCGTALMILNQGRLDRRDLGVLFAGGLFITYTIFVAVFKGISWTTLQYVLMWVFNLFLFITVARFFAGIHPSITWKIFHEVIFIILIAAALGIFRFLLGIAPDSNFMPILNKGATSFIIIGAWPILFYLKDRFIIKNSTFWGSQVLMLAFFVMLNNRSGLLGFLFVNLFYFILGLKIKRLVVFVVGILMFIAMSASLESKAFEKLEEVPELIRITLANEDMGKARKEHAQSFDRIMLIRGAVEIIKNEFWFGSGIGRENYQRAFNEHFDYYRQTKPHNLYVSALAEYGMIGYLLLMFFLFSIFRRMPRLRGRNGVLTLSFIGIAFLMSMNEFIGMPEIWFIVGMLLGASRRLDSEVGISAVSTA